MTYLLMFFMIVGIFTCIWFIVKGLKKLSFFIKIKKAVKHNENLDVLEGIKNGRL